MSVILQEINSSVAKLRALLSEAKADLQRIQNLQNSLGDALHGLWDAPDIEQLVGSEKYWREFTSLITSGKIISAAAQADEALASGTLVNSKNWTGDGHEYARWLGRGIANVAASRKVSMKPLADLLGKSFSLGYTDDIVTQITTTMLLQNPSCLLQYQLLASHLARFHQRQFLNSLMSMLYKKCLPLQSTNYADSSLSVKEAQSVAGSIALLNSLVSLKETGFQEYLSSWLTRTPSTSVNILRASIAALPVDEQGIVLQKCWEQFGDKLYVRHAPIIQQETSAQILLLTAGYVHRRNPMHVFVLARSSTHTAGISERIASSSPKARFLGMVVGTAISQIIDKEGARMDFDMDEMKSAEALWYQTLVHVNDKMGKIEDLYVPNIQKANAPKFMVTSPNVEKAPLTARQSGPRIIEILDNDEEDDDDDDLKPYAKPDSDPEDSDEDATNVERNKPTAPVYIRDLLNGLQNNDSYDIASLALTTAAPLIRRKATFGMELLDLCETLASTLTSMQDTFDMPSFHDLRLQALIAILVAQPARMGPWFAHAYFNGDYSLSQRAVVLSTMGLGARELAGYADENNRGDVEGERFPSKRLPDRLHRLYAESSEMDQLARRLEGAMLEPVSTRKRKGRTMVKNDLAKVVADAFFFPLTGRFGLLSTSSTSQHYLSPHLLPLYLKTLAFVLTAAGPSTLALPSMTSEFWMLLLSLRSHVLRSSSSNPSNIESPLSVLSHSTSSNNSANTSSNSASLEALLFALLSLLTLNTSSTSLSQQLAQNHAQELLETHSWVQMVFEATRGGEAEGDRVRTLAAGVMVCIEEVVEGWKGTVMGSGVRRGL